MTYYSADQLEAAEDDHARLELHLSAYTTAADRVRFVRLLPDAWGETGEPRKDNSRDDL